MHRFYLAPEQSEGATLQLTGDEAHHAHHVLRLEAGETVEVLNGAGGVLTCRVAAVDREALELSVVAKRFIAPLPCPVTLVQAIPKGKLFDDIVEKATELGISRIVPLISDRVISRPSGEEALRKTARWKRTAIEALKQCGAAWLPFVDAPVGLSACLENIPTVDFALIASLQPGALELREQAQRFLASHQRAPESASLWIGPEGDFSPAEIERITREARAFPVSLGPWVLRTETAAISGLAILNHEIRNIPRATR